MQNHIIYSHLFYILSGPSASGKSSLTNQLIKQGLPSDAIISTDTIRKQILGSYETIDQNGVKETLHGWKLNQSEIFSIIDNILSLRLQQKLPTIFDATNLNDDIRKKYVELAKKFGVESHIVIFDVDKEELKNRLSNRKERFNFNVVEKQLENFSLTSIYEHTVVKANDKFILLPNMLPTINLDVIGDTHGLLDETIELLKQKKWRYENNMFIHEDPTRKLLFLGDVVDRGTQSIEFIKAVMNTVQAGNGFFINGNHESKLMASYYQYKKEGILRGKSLSSAQTLLKLVALEPQEQEEIYQFLLKSPVHYCLWIDKNTGNITNNPDNSVKFAFAHADNEFYDPYKFTRSNALYGSHTSDEDNDTTYEKNYLKGINQYIYFRGHVSNKSQQNHLYSLEDNQAFAGNLVCLDLPNYIKELQNNHWNSEHRIFETNITKYKTAFNFDEYIRENVLLLKKMNDLVKNGLVYDGSKKSSNGERIINNDGFRIYKYSDSVHYKNLWHVDPILRKARGLVLDIAGNIVSHPFDKLYSYDEYKAGKSISPIEPSAQVQVIEKLNGFLGCISKHPFRNELLINTTGSLDSPFVEYIKSFINEDIKVKLLEYFKTHKQTLMFEVIHPEDKHIIEYSPQDYGLWLIGARGLNIDDKIVSEQELDAIGQTLNLRRAKWEVTTFQDVLNRLSTSELEGFMIRDVQTNEPLMKIKTNYYLVTKLMGRMGKKLTNKMYKNTEKFKEKDVDEEFYPIVDQIVSSIKQSDFENMEHKARTELIKNIIDEHRKQFKLNSALKSK